MNESFFLVPKESGKLVPAKFNGGDAGFFRLAFPINHSSGILAKSKKEIVLIPQKSRDMSNFIERLEIRNFKSIKEMDLECARVNLFVGEPNVGKSNILEALSLFSAPYSLSRDKFLSEFIRYEEVSNLFYFQDLTGDISVETNLGGAYLRYFAGINVFDLTLGYLGINEELNQFRNTHEIIEFIAGKPQSTTGIPFY